MPDSTTVSLCSGAILPTLSFGCGNLCRAGPVRKAGTGTHPVAGEATRRQLRTAQVHCGVSGQGEEHVWSIFGLTNEPRNAVCGGISSASASCLRPHCRRLFCVPMLSLSAHPLVSLSKLVIDLLHAATSAGEQMYKFSNWLELS